VFAFTLQWPASGKLVLAAVHASADMTLSMLGYGGPVKWTTRPQGGISIEMPTISYDKMPCSWAWTFKLINVAY